MDLLDELVEESLPTILSKDPLEMTLSHFDADAFDIEGHVMEVNSLLDGTSPLESSSWVAKYEPLPPLADSPALSSIVSPPKLDLKPLPTTLKYVFLGNNETLPVIISSQLSCEQEEKVIRVLSEHKRAIGWSVADLKGIAPSICMHRIFLEDDAKPSR